ncbi:hypothetical protein F5B18DRAFT_443347 [Nemania serpens]|nr:hypothetical protein F5B18DRAFT_443347 [Nemania serpens]
MSDPYLRTGRGGAGNLYSHQDVEDAVNKDRSEDLEAQRPPAHQLSTTSPSSGVSDPGVSRSGRGGAGNITVSPTVLPSTSSSPSLLAATTTAVASVPSSKHTGRGGAGNWAEGDGESEGARHAKAEQDRRRKEALDAGIAREIRASLPPPPRTYHLHQPGRGRRPEADGDDVLDV